MADPPIVDLGYLEYNGRQAEPVRRPVIAETPWVLYVDRQELLTTMCTPTRVHCMALGFLRNEGLIASLEDVWQLRVFTAEDRVYTYFPDAGLDAELTMRTCEEAVGSIDVRLRRPLPPRREQRILTSGCGGGVTFDDLAGERAPLDSSLRIAARTIFELMRAMNMAANLYSRSRGVHTSSLFSADGRLIVLAEDVGRHNTLDKIRGECLLRKLPTQDHILITSGRISTEMIGKAYKMGVPIVASRTSPTVTSVRLARAWGITLIGYVRSQHLRVYAGAERLDFDNWAEVGRDV